MKPGIYLIEVKECPWAHVHENKVGVCATCHGSGYTETRINAEEWLLSMLRRVEWANPTGFMDALETIERMGSVRFVEPEAV